MSEPTFLKVSLITAEDGRARFTEAPLPLPLLKGVTAFSESLPASAYQLRRSPPSFASDFHCTEHPQWVFILRGIMEIGLQDGSWRAFHPGQHFFSADTLPLGAVFDPHVHGHRSRCASSEPRETLFVRV